MARQTKADLEDHIKFQDQLIETQAARITELMDERDNLKAEVIRLRKQLANKTEPTETKQSPRGRKQKYSIEQRQLIRELWRPVDGSGRHLNSLADISAITGASRTQIFAIVREPETPGRWYSDQDGTRTYYEDYTAAVRSEQTIHFEKTV